MRAPLLQMLCTIRGERMPVEQREYDLLFRWFVGLEIGDRGWGATTFTKNTEIVC